MYKLSFRPDIQFDPKRNSLLHNLVTSARSSCSSGVPKKDWEMGFLAKWVLLRTLLKSGQIPQSLTLWRGSGYLWLRLPPLLLGPSCRLWPRPFHHLPECSVWGREGAQFVFLEAFICSSLAISVLLFLKAKGVLKKQKMNQNLILG